MEPLRYVLRRWIDRIEWRHVIDASVIELPGQQFELLSGTDEVDRYGIAVDATAPGREVCLDLVRVTMQRLRDAAIFTQIVRSFETRLDADRERTRWLLAVGCWDNPVVAALRLYVAAVVR